jgi:hypothetical protein
MRGVYGRDGRLELCIDPYETVLTGALGSADQYGGGVPTTATAVSAAGVLPTVYISYDQAFAACANTPVYGRDGALVGRKRMPTSAEWQDAADGVSGAGGTAYPYGDVWDPTACVTLAGDGRQVYQALQPTALLLRCVSPFGVYDQSGNAWEWTDPGISVDIAGWFRFAAGYGIDVQADPDGLLFTRDPTDVLELLHTVIEAQPPELEVDGDGYLFAPTSSVTVVDHPQTGYLKVAFDGRAVQGDANFLPVTLVNTSLEPGGYHFRFQVVSSDDGAPVPDKRGGAYYNGELDTADDLGHLEHLHDFNGTIAVRCACDPIEAPGP